MKKLLVSCIAVIAVLLSGCSQDYVGVGDIDVPEAGENFLFYKSSNMAEKTSHNRSTDISDPFDINKVWITEEDGNKYLHIEVNQIQGCEETFPEKFDVIWDGMIAMIYPQVMVLYLKLNTDGCSKLKENVKETLTLDLYDLIEDKSFVDASNFMVVNASSSSTGDDKEVIQHTLSE